MVRHADLQRSSPTTAGTRSSSTVAATSTSTASTSTSSAGDDARSPGSSRWSRPDGAVRQVADGIEFPNGMVVTPDNSTLIIAESFAGRLTAFDIAADGSLSNRRVWADGSARRHLPRRRRCICTHYRVPAPNGTTTLPWAPSRGRAARRRIVQRSGPIADGILASLTPHARRFRSSNGVIEHVDYATADGRRGHTEPVRPLSGVSVGPDQSTLMASGRSISKVRTDFTSPRTRSMVRSSRHPTSLSSPCRPSAGRRRTR